MEKSTGNRKYVFAGLLNPSILFVNILPAVITLTKPLMVWLHHQPGITFLSKEADLSRMDKLSDFGSDHISVVRVTKFCN